MSPTDKSKSIKIGFSLIDEAKYCGYNACTILNVQQ